MPEPKNCGALKTALAWLLLQASCHPASSQDTPDAGNKRVDLGGLQKICQEQSVVDKCPANAQFCSEKVVCPQQEQVCSCEPNCGNLMCVLPDDGTPGKVCGYHPVPRDGYIVQRAEELIFHCEVGFQLAGPPRKHCDDGQWHPLRNFPRCNAVQCGAFPSPSGGTMLLNSNSERTYDTTASLRCNLGHTLVGASTIRCQADGTWTSLKASCRRDGEWLPWSAWSPCDAQCASGLQRRKRRCQEPEEGGRSCDGDLTEDFQVCNTGVICKTHLLSCYSSAPWTDEPVRLRFDHHSFRGNVHRCLHHCKNAKKNYSTLAVHDQDSCWCFDTYTATEGVTDCTSQESRYKLYAAPQGRCTRQKEVVEKYVTSYVEQYQAFYTTRCGLWHLGWITRCRRSVTKTRLANRHQYRTKMITVEC